MQAIQQRLKFVIDVNTSSRSPVIKNLTHVASLNALGEQSSGQQDCVQSSTLELLRGL